MTPTELVHLATAAFPGLTFTPIGIGTTSIAQSRTLSVHHRPRAGDFSVTIRGDRCDYQGTGDTIEAAHADALAVKAEHEPPVEPVPATQGALDL